MSDRLGKCFRLCQEDSLRKQLDEIARILEADSGDDIVEVARVVMSEYQTVDRLLDEDRRLHQELIATHGKAVEEISALRQQIAEASYTP